MKKNIDRTLVVKNIIAKYTNMKQYMKYLCAVLLVIGSYASAWGADATYYVWDSSRNDWVAYVVQDENATVVEGPTAPNGKTFIGWHIWNPDVYPNWITTGSGYIETDGGAYYSAGGEYSTKYVRYIPNSQGNTAEKNTGKNDADDKFYAVYSGGTTDWTKNAGWSASSTTQVTITFNKNDANATGTMASQTVLSNTTTYLQICEFEAPDGKVFAGWATSPSGSVEYSDMGAIRITSNTTLYAKWEDPCIDIRALEVSVNTVPTPTYNCTSGKWETTISWSAVTGATTYKVRMMKWNGDAFSYIGTWANAGSSTSYTYDDLETGEKYRAKVVGLNGDCPTISVTNDNHTLYGSGQGKSNDFTITCPSVGTPEAVVVEGNTSAELMWEATGEAGCDMVYDVVVKKHSDNSTAWSVSSTTATGGTATGLTGNTQYDVYVTATNGCGNSNNNSGAVVETFTTTTVKTYVDNKWTCIDLRLVQTDGNTSDPLLITGGYGLGTSSVEATRTLTLTIGGVAANSTVQLSGTNLRFFKNNDDHTEIGNNNLTCDASGNLSAVIKVEYAPTAYTDDNIATPSITVTCDGNVREFTGLVKARCLPEKFVVAAKINGRWCALPADLATSSGTTVQNAYPISVDNLNAPRVATVVPKNAVYGFKARNAVKSHTGGIRLTSKIDETVYHLQAPRSNSLTYLWRTTSNSTKGMQEWYLTSTGKTESTFYTYNIGVDPDIYVSSGSGDGEGEGDSGEKISRYLCVYDNKIYWGATATKTFRILPVEDEIEPVDMQVVEWKADKVVFMYLGNPAYKASVEINGVLKSAASTSLSSLEVDHGVYEIAVSDLMTSAYQPLYIIIKNGETEIGRKTVTVPLLVNTTTTIDEARTAVGITNKNDCQNVDLVVLNGGKLSSGETTDGAKFTFNSITVYGGGKLILPENNHMRAKAMYMRAGRVDGGVYKYVYPQLHIGSGVTFTIDDNIINYDYLTNYNQYFGVAFPQTLTISNSNIFYPADIYGSAAKTGSYLLRVFDSKIRAARGAVDDVWVDVEEGSESSGGSVAIQASTTRGLGYYVLLPPRKVSVNSGAATRQTYGLQRMKLNVGSAAALTTAETSNAEISVTSYSSDQVYNAGWMMLANPYLADLGGSGVGDTEAAITVGKLGTNAQGAYEWQDKSVRYVTVPNDDASDTYDQRAVSSYTFPAFKPFYVQVGATGKVTFGTSSRDASAPMRFNALGMPSEIATSVALNSEAFGDTTHILIGEDFTEEYEIGDDLMKMPHANVSLFTIMGGCDLFSNALNSMSARASIPVGYTAPTEGTYVFTVNDQENSQWIGNIWLTDYELDTRVDLLQVPYEFTTVAGTNKTRFALSIELRSPGDDTPTDIPEVDEDTEATEPTKFIHNDKMYIQYNGVIYDATGKRVREINK